MPKKTQVTQKEKDLIKSWDSVGDSVGDSVRDSVWASVGAYTSSYFDIDKWKYVKNKQGINPYQSCINLWEDGLVPVYDGKKWMLLSGENADIVYTQK